MKKYFIVSNIILIVAVIVLFYLQFSKKITPANQPVATNDNETITGDGQLRIAYFEMDSLDNNYQYLQEVKGALIAKNKSIENQINDLRQEVQAKINEYSQKGPTLSQAEQMTYSKEIDNLTNQNKDKAQRLGQSLSMERDTKLQQVRQRIQDYLKSYAKNKGYSYIIGTNESDYFYYKDSTLDITQELVKGLNAAYKDDKKGQK